MYLKLDSYLIFSTFTFTNLLNSSVIIDKLYKFHKKSLHLVDTGFTLCDQRPVSFPFRNNDGVYFVVIYIHTSVNVLNLSQTERKYVYNRLFLIKTHPF